jgi:hypothetical protein
MTWKDPIPNRLSYPGDVYTCPLTGWEIQKGLTANLHQRKGVLLYAEKHPEAIPTILTRCRQSFSLWCNLFAWTYRVHETGDDGRTVAVKEEGVHVPFVTWPVQDEAAEQIIDSLNSGSDLLLDKSRDMGASWLILTVFHWQWLFYRGVELREISRKEEYVDSGAKSLFWKHDYLNRHLPAWMRPPTRRRSMYLENLATKSTIAGESTNKDAGRGDRAKGILIDEAAAIDQLEPVLRATDQAGPRIFNSTPAGPGVFADLRFSGKIRVVVLPWYRHPEKGVGATCRADPKTGAMRWDGPWRQAQIAAKTAREVAQNVDMDHAAAGAMFFDPATLTAHRATYAQEPWMRGTVLFQPSSSKTTLEHAMRKGMAETVRFHPERPGVNDVRHLALWFDPAGGRPLPEWRCVIGVDISHGAGASQSCAAVYDAITGCKLAELIDSEMDPVTFADAVALLGWWFGAYEGKGAALVVPEANGPGGMFLRRLQQLSYPHIYRHIPSGQASDKSGRAMGWVSNQTAPVRPGPDERPGPEPEHLRPQSMRAVRLSEVRRDRPGQHGVGRWVGAGGSR